MCIMLFSLVLQFFIWGYGLCDTGKFFTFEFAQHPARGLLKTRGFFHIFMPGVFINLIHYFINLRNLD